MNNGKKTLKNEQMKRFQKLIEQLKKKATQVTENDVENVVANRTKIINKAGEFMKTVFEDVKLLCSLVKDYYTGAYRQVNWQTIALVVVTLLYFLSPIDLIPDSIPVAGYLDDLTVLEYCLQQIHSELESYKSWKNNL